MIIRIDTITWIIEIEKGEDIKTAPIDQHPIQIQYNDLDITRKYYKKGDPKYHRKPLKKSLKTLRSDKTVKQEPLLDFHY